MLLFVYEYTSISYYSIVSFLKLLLFLFPPLFVIIPHVRLFRLSQSFAYFLFVSSFFVLSLDVLLKVFSPLKTFFKKLAPQKIFPLYSYTNFFSLQNTNDTNAHLSSLISPSQQTALKEMSRVKIVKEAGAKPTDFENTVAKVRRSILTRSENRRGRGRVAVMYRREIQLARFCTRKWGSRVSARKKRRGREAELKKRARGLWI